MNTIDPKLAHKQSKFNQMLGAANGEYHVRFLEAVVVLNELEQLQQWAGDRQMTRRRPLFSAQVVEQYEKDLQRTIPSSIDEDEARVKALMDEVRHRCGLPYYPVAGLLFDQAYYLESDRSAVEDCQKRAAQLQADLEKATETMRETWTKLEKLRYVSA